MKIDAVRHIARGMGIELGMRSNADMIRTMQLSEGGFDCFAPSIDGEHDQILCASRDYYFLATKTGETS